MNSAPKAASWTQRGFQLAAAIAVLILPCCLVLCIGFHQVIWVQASRPEVIRIFVLSLPVSALLALLFFLCIREGLVAGETFKRHLILLAIVSLNLLWFCERELPGWLNIEKPKASVDSSEQHISFSGGIDRTSASTLRTALLHAVLNNPGNDGIVLKLDSGGGVVDEMSLTLDELNEIKKTTPVTTMIATGKTCASACVHIWAAGSTRVIEDGAAIMIHDAHNHQGWGGEGWFLTYTFFRYPWETLYMETVGDKEYARNLLKNVSPELYDFAVQQGVYTSWTVKNCWLSAAEVRAIVPGVLGGAESEPVTPSCHDSDPREHAAHSQDLPH